MKQLGLYLLHCSPQSSALQAQSSTCLSAFAQAVLFAQKAFPTFLSWELLSLPGLSLNTTSSVKPPEACQPRGRPDQCPFIPAQGILVPH